MLLNGKIAIVTGAANGLGEATARRFVEEGARVLLTDIDGERVGHLASELGPNARGIRLDVRSEDQWQDALALVKAEFGDLSVMVNNAAVPAIGAIESLSFEDWQRVSEINAGGAFLGCKYAMQAMMAAGGGAIVNVSSNSTMSGMAEVPLYSSTKASMNTLTRSIAARCLRDKLPIRCNTVVPGGMITKMARDAFLDITGVDISSGTEAAQALAAAANLVDAVEVADVVVMMASDMTRRVNGAEVVADGGQSASFGHGG